MSSRLPPVSIVTPTLDSGVEALRSCLESVAAQRYAGEIQHVVIDGGSRDGTVDFLRSRSEIEWVSEPDSGQAQAINKGFARSTGQVLTWLNADDTLEVGAVERAVSAIEQSPGSGWVYGDLRIVEPGTTWIHRPPYPPALEDFRDGCPIPGVGTFLTRWALDAVGPLDESLNLAMDLDLWVRLMDASIPTAYVRATQATFNLHPGSKTANRNLAPRYREQVLVFTRLDHPELAARAMERWSWWATRSEFATALQRGDVRAARAAAVRGISRSSSNPLKKRVGLRLMATMPRLAARLLRKSGHWVEGAVRWE